MSSDPREPGAAYGVSFARLYDVITGHKSYDEEIGALAGFLRSRLGGDQGQRILDLGCGTGSHAIRLREEGFEVVGIDLSPEMIEVADEKESDVAFHAGDIRSFENGGFDGVVSLFNVINCLPSMDDLVGFLTAARQRMNDHGAMIVEAWNAVAVMADPPTVVEREYEFDGGTIRRKATPVSDFMNQKLLIRYEISINGGEAFTVDHPLVLFMPWEIRQALERSGFGSVETLTALPGLGPAGDTDRMLAFVCRAESTPS